MAATQKQLLLLFSDTGGGHRSAAEAIVEQLEREHGGTIRIEMVDFLKCYAPPPFNKLPELYPRMVKLPRAWGWGYRLSDGQRRIRLLTTGIWPYVRKRAQALIAQHPWDLVVSVHHLANSFLLKAMSDNRPPFITVVTDLVSTHALWYDRRADLCVVPTEPARRLALAQGLRPEQVRVIGLPVSGRFEQLSNDPRGLRTRWGWPSDRPVVLLMGGADGMGPLEKTARSIAQAGLPITLAVITGRNKGLQGRLEKEARTWPSPTFVYGFVREMPSMMTAADILVTKAGPGTLCEAFTAGLPLVLYSYLPGQEAGNITYVESNGAGVWAPTPENVVAAIQNWVADPTARRYASLASRALARPYAAKEIAQILINTMDGAGIPNRVAAGSTV